MQAQTGCDFRCYKKSTILRRIERRMGLHRIADMAQYGALLAQDAGEVAQLLKDLLINVTAFFRDAEAFEELRHKAIAPLVEAKTGRRAVAGLGARLLLRRGGLFPGHAADGGDGGRPQDLPRAGVRHGHRRGGAGVRPPGRLPREHRRRRGAGPPGEVLRPKGQGYQVGESLRNSVVFAAQNLITDPPFSKMDLISCRNLLIYLDADTQAKLIPLFNFALNPGGYLFLGKSEGIGGQTDLFSLVSKKARLYRRLAPARPIVLDTPILPGRKSVFPIGPPASLRPPPARQYRKEFSAAKPIRRATIYATALGIYELYVNGRRVGDAVFAPGWTDYHKRAYYNTYDVTDLVRQGENAIGAWVADGWYSGYVGFGLLGHIGTEGVGRYIYGKTPAVYGPTPHRVRRRLDRDYHHRRQLEDVWRRPHSRSRPADGRGLRRPPGNARLVEARLRRPAWQPAILAEQNGLVPAKFMGRAKEEVARRRLGLPPSTKAGSVSGRAGPTDRRNQTDRHYLAQKRHVTSSIWARTSPASFG